MLCVIKNSMLILQFVFFKAIGVSSCTYTICVFVLSKILDGCLNNIYNKRPYEENAFFLLKKPLERHIDRLQEEFEDTKGVIRIRKIKEEQTTQRGKKKDKSTNNDLQNITHKTKI